ncbi:MAG TPA: hypothetical protein DF383_06090, partial [Deltaproteobacteria bacterium]|nr:hypothetical protein [Deltaproteobacteria bacterium]
MIQIIDASVAIKWFIAEEKGRKAALELLDEIGKKPQWFAVPEFFFNEMLSVLCRLLSRPELIQEHIEGLQNLGLSRLGNGAETLACPVQMAKKYRLWGYD